MTLGQQMVSIINATARRIITTHLMVRFRPAVNDNESGPVDTRPKGSTP